MIHFLKRLTNAKVKTEIRPTRGKKLGLEILESRQLLSAVGFAPYDGVGNNVDQPFLGAAGQQFDRIAEVAYEDGLSAPARSNAVNPREISNLVAAQNESVINDRFITSAWFQWGQLLDHDINRAFDVAPFEQTSETTRLDISPEFPFFRSPYDPSTGTSSPRQHVNHVTSFIDGSVVYGISEQHSMSLRTMNGGQMRSIETPHGELLPLNTDGLINVPAPTPNFFIAGDVRVNENVGLTSIQTLWLREHNRIAQELAATEFAGRDLSDPEVDELIFQRSRQMVTGLLQHITYNEFLPSTIGFNAIETYSGYNPNVNPAISNEFSTAVFRIGHSTLPNELMIGSDGTTLPLADAFFKPEFVQQYGIEGILEGLTLQKMEEVDHQIVDAVRNFLDDGPGFDLAAINIQRGRDHGLPGYNEMREAIGLQPIGSFDELTSNQELAEKFQQIYGTPDHADPWIAMISEDHVPGTMTGETMLACMVDQFTRLRDGDRFWFQNVMDQSQIDEIKATRLSDVIERNTDLQVQDEVFWTRDTLVFRNGLDNEWLIRDFGDQGGAEVVFFGEPGIRDPNNRDETIPVQRDEPINAIIVAGTNQLGDGFFIPNALVSSPLADLGIDEFIITADIEFFEGYGLGGQDRWILEGSIDSIFASGDSGKDTLRVTTAATGAEIGLTGGSGRDHLKVHAPNSNFVIAHGNAGHDDIHVQANNSQVVSIDGGTGHDRIRISAMRAGLTSVSGGGGHDLIRINATQARQVNIEGNSGNDRILVRANNSHVLTIDGGIGHDRIHVFAVRANLIHLVGGHGHDRIGIKAMHAGDVQVEGNGGNDILSVNGRYSEKLFVSGGSGRDQISVWVDLDLDYIVDGGLGRDRIKIF